MNTRDLATSFNAAWLRRSGVFRGSVFRYDQEVQQDGLGSQLQRVLGVYVLAKYFGAHYEYSPIKHLGFTGVTTPDVDGFGASLVARAAERFRLPNNPSTMNLQDFRIKDVAAAVPLIKKHGPSRFHIASPARYLDANTGLWALLAPSLSVESDGRHPLRVAVHVRRGDLHFVESSRKLDNAYYIAVAARVGEILTGLGIDHRFEIYSEAVANNVQISRLQFAGDRPVDDVILKPQHDRISEFRVLSPCPTMMMGGDPLDTLLALATADVLVTSRSSFSYVPGLLDQRKVMLFHPFWHRPLPGWIKTKSDGSFSRLAFTRAIAMQRRFAFPSGTTAPPEAA